MSLYKCLMNGAVDADIRLRVEAGLSDVTAAHLGQDALPCRVEFVEVEPGAWYTAGKPSSASMVLGSVPAGTSTDTRTALMSDVATVFSAVTGADIMDVMVVAADARETR